MSLSLSSPAQVAEANAVLQKRKTRLRVTPRKLSKTPAPAVVVETPKKATRGRPRFEPGQLPKDLHGLDRDELMAMPYDEAKRRICAAYRIKKKGMNAAKKAEADELLAARINEAVRVAVRKVLGVE